MKVCLVNPAMSDPLPLGYVSNPPPEKVAKWLKAVTMHLETGLVGTGADLFSNDKVS